MQFLSSTILLYVRVVLLITIAFYLIKDPEGLSTLGVVVLLGQAMQVPLTRLESSSSLSGFTALLLSLFALQDLIPLLSENIAYFENLVPVRLSIYFLLCIFIYFKPDSFLSNSMVITFSFTEIWLNFLIYNNLKDEKYFKMKKYIEENKDQIIQERDEQIRVAEDRRTN